MVPWFSRARPDAGTDRRLIAETDKVVAQACLDLLDRKPAHRFISYTDPDWRWGFDKNEEIARISQRRQEEEGERTHIAREEAAVGKRGHVAPNVVQAQAPSQDEIQRQIYARHWAFTAGSIVGMAVGFLGGSLGMVYILLLLGKIKL